MTSLSANLNTKTVTLDVRDGEQAAISVTDVIGEITHKIFPAFSTEEVCKFYAALLCRIYGEACAVFGPDSVIELHECLREKLLAEAPGMRVEIAQANGGLN